MLKAYMHGYFIEMRAYQKLLSVADPFAYERFRKEQINQKLNSLREKRIQVTKQDATNLPKVNKDLVKELLDKDAKKSSGAVDKLMQDDRFKKMFQDKEFEIDKNTDAYKFLKSGNVNKRVKEDDVDSIVSGDDEPAPKGKDLNKLFSGKNDEDKEGSDESQDNSQDFQAKMSKKQRK